MTKDIGKKLLKYTNHRTNIPQITEQIFHKSPNKSSTNHRTNLPQITEQIFHKSPKIAKKFW